MDKRDKLLAKNQKDNSEKNRLISEAFEENEEIAIIRKEIKHIEDALNIQPTAEFSRYYQRAEEIKAEVKHRLHPNEE